MASSGPTAPPGRRLGAGPGLSPSIPVSIKRLDLGFPGGGVTLVVAPGQLGGGAGRGLNEAKAVERMRSSGFLVLIVAAFAVSGCRSAGHGASGGDGVSARGASALLEREQAWTDAMRHHDYDALEQILAAEFRLTFVILMDRPGKPEITREQWLENMEHMTFGLVEMHDQRVVMHGENVATVRMRMILHDWMIFDNQLPPDYDLTDVWAFRDNRWQVINRISEPIE